MTSSPSFVRLVSVDGYDGRKNDVIFVRAKLSTRREKQRQTLVFFGGDVQDYPENMSTHRDNHRYIEWNLESTTKALSQSFPEHDVMSVKASRMYLKTFACYENFLSCNDVGAPMPESSESGADAHRHLIDLVSRAYELSDAETPGGSVPRQSHADSESESELVLVGFSKGCVVLNQLVREIHQQRSAPTKQMSSFVSRVKDIYWLDGGHSGGSDVWITDVDVLKSLADTGIRLHVHVTPYQMEDQRRPWIRREEKIFSTSLLNIKANISRVLHFNNEEPSIEHHFKVLRAFRSP